MENYLYQHTPLLILITICALIVLDDYRKRLIRTWLLAAFTVVSCAQFVSHNSISLLLANALFCLVYFLTMFLAVKLIFYWKTGQQQSIINARLGLADIWIILSIGFCLSPPLLVLFFTASFCISIAAYFLYRGTKNNVPLAGNLAFLYITYLLIDEFSPGLLSSAIH